MTIEYADTCDEEPVNTVTPSSIGSQPATPAHTTTNDISTSATATTGGENSKKKKSRRLKLGLGIGLPVLILILVSSVLLYCWKKGILMCQKSKSGKLRLS